MIGHIGGDILMIWIAAFEGVVVKMNQQQTDPVSTAQPNKNSLLVHVKCPARVSGGIQADLVYLDMCIVNYLSKKKIRKIMNWSLKLKLLPESRICHFCFHFLENSKVMVFGQIKSYAHM